MSSSDIFGLVASVFSIALAIFAIWFAVQQRRESQEAYEKTKEILASLNTVMDKTQLLVSDNFQNLLSSITNQQGQMLEALKPRPSQEALYAELFAKLAAEDPDKLAKVAEAVSKFQDVSPQQNAGGMDMSTLMQLAALGENVSKE